MSMKSKKVFQWKYVVWGISALQCIVSAILGWRLISMGMLPDAYMVVYVLLVLGLDGLTILMAGKKVPAFLLCIICILVSCVMGYGVYALNQVNTTVENVTRPQEEVKSEMAILVMANSEAKEITDLSQFHIGYVTEETTTGAKQVMEEIHQYVGGDVTYLEYSNVLDMVDALYDGTVSAIILDTAFVDMIQEMDGYTDFLTETKVIHSFQVVDYIKIVKKEEPAAETEPNDEAAVDTETNKRDKSKQFIVYISGIDTEGDVSKKSRSDVNILAIVNTETRQVQLINTPRDYFVELPNSKGVKDKLTHAGIYGIESSIGALEMLYDIDVDYYVRMNFSGFEKIIDAVGGIDVYSECEFHVGTKYKYVEGMNHLNGDQALMFARIREVFSDGDVQRGRNQMAVITGMIKKVVSSDILAGYTEVLDAVSSSFQTNMSSEEIYALVKTQLSDPAPWTVGSYTVAGSGASSTTFSMPNRKAYVMIPNENMVETAKELIQAVFSEE
ncbi:MAG: LCP family protein [Lachnospiraceae bacterium]|nr:LCP family protein [Lachnospiraceae bacterium]